MIKDIPSWQERTMVLLGEERVRQLAECHVLVVGVGGVGGMAAEMLCRGGIGRITLLDADSVAASNINRQIVALHSTVGKAKVGVLRDRLRDINPNVHIDTMESFLESGKAAEFIAEIKPDFVIDAIDTIKPKCDLIVACLQSRLPIVSSMGAGAKDDISQIRFANLWDTYHCGLAKAVRKGLMAAGLRGRRLPVVFCAQQANPEAIIHLQGERNKKTSAGTISYMPATFGNFLAAYVLKNIVPR